MHLHSPRTLRRLTALLLASAVLTAPYAAMAQAHTPRWVPTAEQRQNAQIMAFYLVDDWTTELGRLTISQADPDVPDRYVGHLYANGASTPTHLLEGLAPSADASGLTGVWRKVGGTRTDVVRIVLSLYDGDVFSAGFNGGIEGRGELGGRRGFAGPTTPPPAPQPVPAPAPPPVPPAAPAPPPAPSEGAGFTALRKYDVRIDRVVAARDAQRIDVFMTVRNASAGLLYLTSGSLQVRIQESDGTVNETTQVLRPTPEGRTHFNSTPVLEPERELKVKYSFHPNLSARPTKVTVIEGDKRAEFGV